MTPAHAARFRASHRPGIKDSSCGGHRFARIKRVVPILEIISCGRGIDIFYRLVVGSHDEDDTRHTQAKDQISPRIECPDKSPLSLIIDEGPNMEKGNEEGNEAGH